MNVQDLHSIYQLRIELRGIRPPIWRRILVRNSSILADLHIYIQIAMGWEDCHMHQFNCDGVAYGMSEEMEYELDYRISQLLKKEGDTLLYEYDFGDGWQHDLKLERILPFETDQVLPVCVGGKRGGPPEDIGGIPGYEMCLNVLTNRDDPANEELLDFVVEDFDPDYFDANDVNENFRLYEQGL